MWEMSLWSRTGPLPAPIQCLCLLAESGVWGPALLLLGLLQGGSAWGLQGAEMPF